MLAPLDDWAGQCHAASIELMRARGEGCRVARGVCTGVGAQHSWLVLGDDCYEEDAVIVDGTLWSYDETVTGVWVGTYRDGRHRPHGKGRSGTGADLMTRPAQWCGPRREPFSATAKGFLELLGPLDFEGWCVLAHAPVQGWPAAEILDAIANTEGLEHRVPIDILGMITSRNPSGLYLPDLTEETT